MKNFLVDGNKQENPIFLKPSYLCCPAQKGQFIHPHIYIISIKSILAEYPELLRLAKFMVCQTHIFLVTTMCTKFLKDCWLRYEVDVLFLFQMSTQTTILLCISLYAKVSVLPLNREVYVIPMRMTQMHMSEEAQNLEHKKQSQAAAIILDVIKWLSR